MNYCTHEHVATKSCSGDSIKLGRRKFLKFATMAGGAALFLSKAPAAFAGQADALVLTCMDYRLADDVHRFMDAKGMTDKYDHVILAGASVGVMHDAFAEWHDTFWSHLDVAIDLHAIHKVMIIDHRDCGAYKIAFGKDLAADKADETRVHGQMIARLAKEIEERKPGLEVEGYIMALDGSVARYTL